MSGTDPIDSAYWPPGWSRNRLVKSTSSELLDLPDKKRDRMNNSPREVLDPENYKALLNEMSTHYKARLAAEEGSTAAGDGEQELPPHLRAPFLATLRRLYPNEASFGNWGFVVYPLAYRDEQQWVAFLKWWNEILSEQLRNYDGVLGVAEAVQQLEFRWIDDQELEGASLESIARYVHAH